MKGGSGSFFFRVTAGAAFLCTLLLNYATFNNIRREPSRLLRLPLKCEVTSTCAPPSPTRFALVLPFIDSQVESRLFYLLDVWGRPEYDPCDSSSLKNGISIFFYHPENFTSKHDAILAHARQLNLPCVQSIEVLFGNLPLAVAMKHPSGPCAQFYKAFELLDSLADVFYVMEPDNFPIRSGWLTQLYEEAQDNSFWIKGAVSRCDFRYGEIKSRQDFHFNGNAFYRLHNYGFSLFLDRVKSFYPEFQEPNTGVAGCATGEGYENGHDHAIYQFLKNRANDEYVRSVLHRFVYTNVVINFCEQNYNLQDVKVNNPETFLVHSKGPILAKQLVPHSLLAATSNLDCSNPRNFEYCRNFCFDLIFHEDNSWRCKGIERQTRWLESIPLGVPYIWSNDFHVSPLACSEEIFSSLGAQVHGEIDFNNCIWHPKYCKKRLKVLEFDEWRGFSLDPCPNLLRRRFFDAYKNDPEFWRVDLFVCSHPAANCELFMPFNRSILVYATTRLEFGRFDADIDWRRPYIDDRSPVRWREWIDNLKSISGSPKNFVAANNMYDVHYIKYFTGITPIYLPSWCGFSGIKSSFSAAPAQSSQILIGPYRDNLDFPLFRDAESWKHPVLSSLRDSLSKSSIPFSFHRMQQLYGSNYKWEDISRHPAIVLIPYQVSTMSFFEMYRLNIPLFAPSLQLLCSWVRQHGILWERVYGHPSRVETNSFGNTDRLFDPNSNNTDLEYWLSFMDIYQFEYVETFDSWNDLLSKLAVFDFGAARKNMEEFNLRQREVIKKTWSGILKIATADHFLANKEIRQFLHLREPFFPDFDISMDRLWHRGTIGPDRPVSIQNEKCQRLLHHRSSGSCNYDTFEGEDLVGDNIKGVDAATVSECAQHCCNEDMCDAFSFLEARCYLKSVGGKQSMQENPRVISGILI